MAGRVFLGVDIGTTSLAAVVVDGRGKVLKTFSKPNPSACDLTRDGRHEQDAEAILASVNALIGEAEAFVRAAKREIADIGWTGQMHGVVAVDRDLKPLTPFVTWRDRRCKPPLLSSGVMAEWRKGKLKGVWRALTIPGFVIARRTGKLTVDSTFRAAMGPTARLKAFAKWIPATDNSRMLGDNQAGVYAALKLKPGSFVVNLGTSAQLSQVVAPGERACMSGPSVDRRPFPGRRRLLCRASQLGGAPFAKLRRELGYSWDRMNAEAETNPRIAACVRELVDDLALGADTRKIRTIVGVGNALRLNPCLKQAIERKFHAKCLIPKVEEMAAWGAALHVMDARKKGTRK